MTNLDCTATERDEAWKTLLQSLENFYANTKEYRASPALDIATIKNAVAKNFDHPLGITAALHHVVQGLERFTVHTPHPNYYGLFNPRSNFPSILADTIIAYFNPQLAAWSHAPFAAEIEQKLVKEFGKKFGYAEDDCDGVFTTGGAEANLTAVLAALNEHFPGYANDGLRSLPAQPIIYCSHESHHSIVKAAKIAGLGRNSVREIPVTPQLQISTTDLAAAIEEDKASGHYPLMIVATMGTTGAGAIDPCAEIAAIAKKYRLWLHADAAYGGAIALSGTYRHLLHGIDAADSITFDAHKWLSVTMSGSLFLTRHKDILDKTFRVTADYMPKEAGSLHITDPFTHSIQWSRRFIGLKLYLSLLVFGWKGYEEVIDRSMAIGKMLKTKLTAAGWKIFNHTDLPVICFGKEQYRQDPDEAIKCSQRVIQQGKAWISVYKIGQVNTLRACITNYATTEDNLDELMAALNQAPTLTHPE